MSPVFFGWAIPVLAAPFALYFALRRRAARDPRDVQRYSKKMLIIAGIAGLPLLFLLGIAMYVGLKGEPLARLGVAFFGGLTAVFAVRYVRAWTYALKVRGDSVRVYDRLSGEITVRPDNIDRVSKTESRGVHSYRVRLSDGAKVTLNASEFYLGRLQNTLDAIVNAGGRAENVPGVWGRRGLADRARGGRAGGVCGSDGGDAGVADGRAAGEARGSGRIGDSLVPTDVDIAEYLAALALELQSADTKDRRRSLVSQQLDAAARMMSQSPTLAIQHLKSAKHHVVDTWPRDDRFGPRVLAAANAAIEELKDR